MINIEELFHEGEKLLTIGFDKEDNSVVLTDNYNNAIRLGETGIAFHSESDISISSKGNIKIDGSSIIIDAETTLTAKGSSTELSASGQTKVKGEIVMIN